MIFKTHSQIRYKTELRLFDSIYLHLENEDKWDVNDIVKKMKE